MLWERVMWRPKMQFEIMRRNGTLNADDAYQRHSFVAVYLPVLQAAVTEYVGIWNSHRIRRINENGRYRDSHIPAIIFQEFERLQG
jgi:hypothetical protein